MLSAAAAAAAATAARLAATHRRLERARSALGPRSSVRSRTRSAAPLPRRPFLGAPPGTRGLSAKRADATEERREGHGWLAQLVGGRPGGGAAGKGPRGLAQCVLACGGGARVRGLGACRV